MLLREVMIAHGFKPLVEEWWHFTLENEPYPDTYFTFPVCRDSVKPALHADIQHVVDSPAWVSALPAAQDADQLFIIAALDMDKTTAYISMHEKDETSALPPIPAARFPTFRWMITLTGPATLTGSTTRWWISGMCRSWQWTTASISWIMSTSTNTA